MSSLSELSSNSNVLVEETEQPKGVAAVFTEPSSNDSDMVEIVENVNLRVIQEEIAANVSEIDNLKAPHKKVILSTLGSITTIILGFILGVWGDGIHNILLMISGIAFVPVGMIGGMILPAEIYDKFNQKVSYFNLKLNKLRKKLLENSLKVEIVSGADKLDENWQEVSVIDGDDAAKYLVRIVKDDKGFENIEVKKFRG